MLVRIVTYNFDKDEKGYDDPEFINATHIEDYDKFINFIKAMKGKDIRIENDWYTVDDWVFSFPKNSDCVPSIDVYVCEY